MSIRQRAGRETWSRLRDWDRGQADSERLAAQILRVEGYTAIDPSHPLGGRDGLKDVVCVCNGIKWIGASYFPRGKKEYRAIKKKLLQDAKGVKANDAQGMAFVTNQELKVSERKDLTACASDIQVELFHLERITSILDSPACYGIRLEFLDIEMTKEEQLAYIAHRDKSIDELIDSVKQLIEPPKGQSFDVYKHQLRRNVYDGLRKTIKRIIVNFTVERDTISQLHNLRHESEFLFDQKIVQFIADCIRQAASLHVARKVLNSDSSNVEQIEKWRDSYNEASDFFAEKSQELVDVFRPYIRVPYDK